jgi:hypothetical protein
MTTEPDPNSVPDAYSGSGRTIARTVLLALSVLILFPNLLGGIANGAWPALIARLGSAKWAAWGACIVLMLVIRFTGPRRRRTP